MGRTHRIANCLTLGVLISFVASSIALAGGRESGPNIGANPLLFSFTNRSPRDRVCSAFVGPAFTLCSAFCNGCQNTPRPYCDNLRRSFRQLTRRSSFPCEGRTPTPTSTPTPTRTPATKNCALAAGSYTFTQLAGGTLKPDGLDPFPFPAGGTIVQDVGEPDAECVHETIVPYPGGFSVPTFCIAGVNFTIQVRQSGCGIGRIDSNGGADYTIEELGDTSSPTVCNLPHPDCTEGLDSSAQVNVTVGDGVIDDCPAGTGNAIVSIPVQSTIWADAQGACPDPDDRLDPGDQLIVALPQIFDFSSDATSSDWQDIDPDGCCVAGGGPASNVTPCDPGGDGPLSNRGECLDFTAGTVTLAASGVVPSTGVPIFDTTYTARLPNSVSGPAPLQGVTCASPPEINFAGLRTRCLHDDATSSSIRRAARRARRPW